MSREEGEEKDGGREPEGRRGYERGDQEAAPRFLQGLCGRRPGGGEPAQPGVFLPQEEVPTWSQVSEISWKF